MRSTRLISSAALAATAALALAACGGSSDSTSTDSGSSAAAAGEVTTITVGASPVPQAQILEFVNDTLAADAGISIDIVEYTDYVQPNVALSEGELDANYFQHLPYFEAEVAEKGYDFDHGEGVHIEPLGVYSDTVTDIADFPDGGTLAVSNDPANQARALRLLEGAGLFTLADVEDPTIYDVADNPSNVQLQELDPAQLPIALPDVDAAVINGNYALEAGLVPSEDAIVLESGEDNPYANFLAWRAGDTNPAIATLDELLHTDEVRAYIEETWPNGEVIPAF